MLDLGTPKHGPTIPKGLHEGSIIGQLPDDPMTHRLREEVAAAAQQLTRQIDGNPAAGELIPSIRAGGRILDLPGRFVEREHTFRDRSGIDPTPQKIARAMRIVLGPQKNVTRTVSADLHQDLGRAEIVGQSALFAVGYDGETDRLTMARVEHLGGLEGDDGGEDDDKEGMLSKAEAYGHLGALKDSFVGPRRSPDATHLSWKRAYGRAAAQVNAVRPVPVDRNDRAHLVALRRALKAPTLAEIAQVIATTRRGARAA